MVGYRQFSIIVTRSAK